MPVPIVPPPRTPGLRWRALSEADVPAWAELVAAIEAEDSPAEHYTPEDLRDELLAGSWKDPAATSIAAEDPSGRLLAFGLVDVRPGDVRTVRAHLWGGVHPAARRRGLGSALLAWQCAVGRRLIAAAGKDAPGQLRLHAEDRLADRAALARAAGFTPRRYHLVMRRWLRGPQAPPLPAEPALAGGLVLRPWSPDLDEAVRAAHNEAFTDHPGSEPRTREDWQRWVSGHRDARTDWSFVVLDPTAGGSGPVVAGYTIAFAFTQDWVDGVREGWTGLVGTRAAWRRRGVAAALLTASLRAFAAGGMDAAGLGVDRENPTGALGLYTRLGYAPRQTEVLWALDVDDDGPDPAP